MTLLKVIVLSRFLKKMMKYLMIKYRLLVFTLLVLLFFLEILKKKFRKKSSENDQSTGHFQSFFLLFFIPLTLNLKKNPANQLIKKFWPYHMHVCMSNTDTKHLHIFCHKPFLVDPMPL